MASKNLNFLVIVMFAFSFVPLGTSTSRPATGNSPPAIDTDLPTATCHETRYIDVCTETLKSDPRSTTADLKGLAVIALEAGAEHANTTWSAIAKLKKKTNSTGEGDEGGLVSSLDVCMEEFLEASENLRAAADRLHGPVNQLVSAAMTDAVTCEDAMQEAGYGSFLAERSGYFMKLCSNALAIVLLLSNNH